MNLRMAVVGHVEWIEFVRVESVPQPGEIVTATETWEEPAGGGAVAAVELTRLAGEVSLFCVLGTDELGGRARSELERASVRIHAARGSSGQRRGFCYVDDDGERTITVIGEKPRPEGGDGSLPWEALDETDGVYFTAGDAAAVRQARRARVLVATAGDEAERYQAGDLDPPPKLVISTAGSLGGWAQPGGPYKAAPPTLPYEDTYGAGDCFAAALTFALARRLEVSEALAFASERGALALSRRGAGLTRT